jgi:dihydrofolate synthase/folylpolyglutamate synthase
MNMRRLEERLARFGIRPGLERTIRICESLGRPQKRLNVILVTGTNGKGSVAASLASMLTEAGHRTGAYYSPHIERYNERFRIDGKEITDAGFAPYEDELLGLHDRGFEMTVFEALTAIAYKYFSDKGCGYAVMEIGMGGRFDATNIAEEKMAIVTNVSLEHTEYLGRTVAEIARDKSRIIKNPNGIAVTGCEGEALEEVRGRAKTIGAKLSILGENFSFRIKDARPDGTTLDYHGKKSFEGIFTPLAGRHQAWNAALAIAAAEGLGLPGSAIVGGLGRAEHPGRLQIVNKDPLVVVDGAHNLDGIQTLAKSLDIYGRKKLVCVFSALKDKNWKAMLATLAPKCDSMIVNQMAGERAEDAEAMAKEAGRYTRCEVVPDIAQSVRKAKAIAGKDGMVLICGSLYMLGEAMEEARA